jgi:DNA-binding response OmpR family regulator
MVLVREPGMKKIIITEDIMDVLVRDQSFLQRSDIELLFAATNRLALYMHEAERADLIIANLDSEDITAEELCAAIRDNAELKKVSIIIVSRGGDDDMARIRRCRANAFIHAPVNPIILLGHARQLMDVPARMEYRVPVSLKVEGEVNGSAFLGHSENVSASGILLSSDKPLEPGDAIQCSFFLPNSARINSKGRVIRQVSRVSDLDPLRYGVQFAHLPEELRQAIAEFVDSQRDSL